MANTDLIHACDLCHVISTSISQYAQHVDDYHRGRRYVCHSCNVVSKGLNLWNKHNRELHERNACCTIYYGDVSEWKAWKPNMDTSCHPCEIEFEERTALFHHTEEVHWGRVYECSICSEKLQSHIDLPTHNVNIHEGKACFVARYDSTNSDSQRSSAGQIACKICLNIVDEPSSYHHHHMNCHADFKRSYLCDECEFRTSNAKEKLMHSGKHSNSVKFRVEYEKTTNGDGENDRQLDIIGNFLEDETVCPHCSRVFPSKRGFRHHLAVHKRANERKNRAIVTKKLDLDMVNNKRPNIRGSKSNPRAGPASSKMSSGEPSRKRNKWKKSSLHNNSYKKNCYQKMRETESGVSSSEESSSGQSSSGESSSGESSSGESSSGEPKRIRESDVLVAIKSDPHGHDPVSCQTSAEPEVATTSNSMVLSKGLASSSSHAAASQNRQSEILAIMPRLDSQQTESHNGYDLENGNSSYESSLEISSNSFKPINDKRAVVPYNFNNKTKYININHCGRQKFVDQESLLRNGIILDGCNNGQIGFSCSDDSAISIGSRSSSGSFNTEARLPRENDEIISCCVCFQTFQTKDDAYRMHLLEHMQDYEGKNICPECLVDCTSHDKMVDHFLVVHGKVRKLICPHSSCVLSFRTRRDLELHAKYHYRQTLIIR